jgi:hypothetical protein
MSQDEVELQAQDLINQVNEEIKLKEEKIASTNTNNSLSKAPTNNDLNKEINSNKLSKQNTVINKRIQSSFKSICPSELECLDPPQDIIEEEKISNSEKKEEENENKRNMVRSSISSTDSSLENLTIIHDFNLKLFTLISCIFCISTTTLSIIGSLLFDRLLTFNYGNNVVEEITMNHTMIYILLGVISIFNMGILSMISINNDRMLTKLIYSELNWFFATTQFAFASLFLITLLWETDLWTINVCLSISMLIILILAFYYTEIKRKKNFSAGALIFIFIYISILFSFITYVTIYNISCILLENIELQEPNVQSTIRFIIKIGVNGVQTILSFVVLTYLKDIFFALTSGYIVCAVFIHENFSLKESENITLFIMVITILLGVLLTLCRYGKKVFGYEDNEFAASKDIK